MYVWRHVVFARRRASATGVTVPRLVFAQSPGGSTARPPGDPTDTPPARQHQQQRVVTSHGT